MAKTKKPILPAKAWAVILQEPGYEEALLTIELHKPRTYKYERLVRVEIRKAPKTK